MITVHAVDGPDVCGYTECGEPVRLVLSRVVEEPARRCHEAWRFGPVLLEAGLDENSKVIQSRPLTDGTGRQS